MLSWSCAPEGAAKPDGRLDEAAWPVNAFIHSNDFTGKKVIPFCTSSASDLGDSAKLLAQMAGTGEWLDGVRFPSGVTEDEVAEWLDSLAL
ncbi:MAG: flavodoxin [Candidatus Ventricola sp.]